MEHRAKEETATVTDNVRVRVYDVEPLLWTYPEWYLRSLPAHEFEALAASEGETVHEEVTSNTTCVGLYATIAEQLNPSLSEDNSVDMMGVGDGGSEPSRTDTSIPNEIDRLILSDVQSNGPEIYVRSFVSSFELNGETLTNIGVYSVSGRLLNHSQIAPINKTESRAVTLEVALSFDDVNA